MYLRININHVKRLTGFLVFFIGGICQVTAQYGANDTIVHQAIVYNGDTIELKTLENVYFYSKMTAAQRTAAAKYNRLRNAVYVTYPYARQAGIVMNEMNDKLAGITGKPQRKKYIHSKEAA